MGPAKGSVGRAGRVIGTASRRNPYAAGFVLYLESPLCKWGQSNDCVCVRLRAAAPRGCSGLTTSRIILSNAIRVVLPGRFRRAKEG